MQKNNSGFIDLDKLEEKLTAIILAVFSFLHVKVKDTTVQSLVQFIKFGMVGATNTLISYLLHVVVLVLLKPFNWRWDYIVGNLVAFFLSVLWSFYWNNKYVFTQKEGQHRNLWKALLKTYLSYGFSGIILSNLLSYFWVEVLGISKYTAPLLNLFITIPLNFLINKLWAFKSEPTE